QQRRRVTGWGDGAIVQLGTQILGARESQSGPVFGGEGRLGLGPVTLGVGYLEGRLQPGTSGTPQGRDLVEARIFVSARPLSWLTLSAGPRVRAFVTDAATERWVWWEGRARAQNALASTPLQTYIELWRALSARADLPFANHPELLPRRPLLRRRVRLERAGKSVERIERRLEITHRLALLRELALQLEPVHGAVLSRLKRESREHDGAGDAGDAGTGHKPYR